MLGPYGGLPPRRVDQAAAPAAPGMLPAPQQNIFPVVYVVGPGGRGLFTYSPTVGPGNLVASTGFAAGGTDHGNAYLAYDTTYVRYPNGVWIAFQTGPGGSVWWRASSEAGPWTQFASQVMTFNASLGSPIISVFPSMGFMNNVSGLGNFIEVWIAPSGDTTGVVDTTLINALFASGCMVVHLLPGVFYINAPIIINTNWQSLRGPAYGPAATITCAATSAIAGMIILGTTATAPEHLSVCDLQLFGNANSGHGIISRTENGLIQNVIVQNMSGDGFHFSWDAITPPSFLDSMTMINCYAVANGGAGMFADKYLTSSEFFGCRFTGTTGTGGYGGTYGMHLQGADLKFFGCHPFFFAQGGLFIDAGTDIQVFGGEYESNAVAQIIIDTSQRTLIDGVHCYVTNTVSGIVSQPRDIWLKDVTTYCTVKKCRLSGAPTFAAVEVGGDVANSIIKTNTISPSEFTAVSPPRGIVTDAGGAGQANNISGNTIHCTGVGDNAIDLAATKYNVVNANIVLTADNISEATGGDFNIITSNNLGIGPGAIVTTGAHTIVANNIP